jgi:hypothetical protein
MGALRPAESGTRIAEICREHGQGSFNRAMHLLRVQRWTAPLDHSVVMLNQCRVGGDSG